MFDRFFAVAPETVEFMRSYYGLPGKKISLLPLPGDASLMDRADELRSAIRSQLAIAEHCVVLIHAGKLPGDKLTRQVLEAFRGIQGQRYRLLVAGALDEAFVEEFDGMVRLDSRVKYIGWLPSDRLREVFMASDLLVQPGSLSNTFLDAICCGVPVLLDDTPQGRYLTRHGNGVVVPRGPVTHLENRIRDCTETPVLTILKQRAREVSHHFDYLNVARMSLDGQQNGRID
jgi:glycosyltransferase involved in cell wall biosynthesis